MVDYLLKPVRFDRFFKAISKVLELLKNGASDESPEQNQSDEYIFVKSDYKAVKVHFNDIVFVESMQKYVKFHLTKKTVTTLMSLSSLVDILPSTEFFRCQKSFIVKISKIESVSGNLLIMENGSKVPVSKNLKHELILIIDKNKLL